MSSIAIFIPTLLKGGAEKQAVYLLNALAEEHKVFLVLLFPELGVEKEILSLIKVQNYELVKLKGGIFCKLRYFKKLLKQNNIETLFCYLTQPNLWGSLIGRQVGVKKIYTGIRSTWLPRGKITIEKIASRIVNGAIVNSYAGKTEFSQKKIRNLIVIPNCYVYPKDVIVRKEDKIVNIISVGRFHSAKDYETAICAISILRKNYPNVTYTIIGHGELENKVYEWVYEYGVEDITRVYVNPRNIPNYLQNADIYFSSSTYEGTSNSIMEAMDASLPIVATNVGDNDKLVYSSVNGFLTEIKDSNALANALAKLVSSYQLRVDMGAKSNDILKSNYSFEKFKERYLRLLND